MERVYRTVALVRGENPYLLIIALVVTINQDQKIFGFEEIDGLTHVDILGSVQLIVDVGNEHSGNGSLDSWTSSMVILLKAGFEVPASATFEVRVGNDQGCVTKTLESINNP